MYNNQMEDQQWALLMQELRELNEEMHYLRKELGKVKIELATLRGKNAAWASVIAVAFSALVGWLFKN